MALADQLAQGYQFAAPQDPFVQYGKMQQLQQGQQANQLNQMKMAEYQRAAEETNALRQLDRSSPDYVNQLYRINPTQGLAYEKSQAESKNLALTGRKTEAEIANLGVTGKKTQSDIEAAGLTKQLKTAEIASSVLRGARDQATYDQAKRALGHLVSPESLADYPAAYDPAFIESEIAMGQTLTQRLAAENAARVAATGEGQLKVSQGQLGVARGNLGVAQQRLAQEAQGVTYQTDAQGNIVAVPSRLPAGVAPVARPVIGATGVPIQGKDSTKTAVSEQQAASNIGRLLNAANEIKTITGKDTSSVQPGAAEALASSMGMSGTANLVRPANRQIVQGAQRDALDALLYLATGAAYNKEQLQGQMDAYIPAYTDKPETVTAKQLRMTSLIQSAKARAGKAWTPEMDTAMQALISPVISSTVSGKVTPAAPAAAPAGVDAALWNVMTPEEKKLWQK